MSSPEMKRKRKRKTTPAKKKKPSTTPQSSPILLLPYDLVLNIVARVPRLYHPTLSLVSKSFRSLLASPELYKVRSLLGKTESCLYVCINGYPGGYRWFTLCRKPDKTLTDDEKTGYVLASIPMTNTPPAGFTSVVALGSDIYNIVAPKPFREASSSSSSAFILDCRSHTWRQAPSLPVELYGVSVGLIDGKKIYAAGFCKANSPEDKNSLSVFDPKTQVWDPVPVRYSETLGFFDNFSACIDGKVHVAAIDKMVAYNFKEARWESSQRLIYWNLVSNSFCLIENVLYSFSHGGFTWYDSQARVWRILQGLVGLPKFPHDSRVRLGNFGGKLDVLWDTIPYACGYLRLMKMIWCAVIALERPPSSCEIWGKVEWFSHVLTGDKLNMDLVSVVAATV